LILEQLFFGDAHPDVGDGLRPLSFATVGSDLPPLYQRGRFSLLTYGIHWELEPSLSFFFSGLGYHGGTAPLSDTNKVASWATRVLLIAYAPRRIVDGKSHFALASWPTRPSSDLLVLTQEMTNPL